MLIKYMFIFISIEWFLRPLVNECNIKPESAATTLALYSAQPSAVVAVRAHAR
jgi:hypothetical protein